MLNEIDKDLTQILMQADKKCHQYRDYPWSPTLRDAHLVHQYWTLQLSKIQKELSYEEAYEKICLKLKNVDLQIKPQETVNSKQWQAWQQIRESCCKAQTKWKEFLNTLLKAAKATKNKAWKNSSLDSNRQKKTVAVSRQYISYYTQQHQKDWHNQKYHPQLTASNGLQ